MSKDKSSQVQQRKKEGNTTGWSQQKWENFSILEYINAAVDS